MRPNEVQYSDVSAYRRAASEWPDPLSEEAIRAGLAVVLRTGNLRLLRSTATLVENLEGRARGREKEALRGVHDLLMKLVLAEATDDES